MGAVIFGGRFGHSRGAKMIRSGPIVFVLRFDRRSVRVVFGRVRSRLARSALVRRNPVAANLARKVVVCLQMVCSVRCERIFS